jgi:hypothetical protein
MSALTADDCEREIRALHDFFVAWYCGTCDEGAFARLERALAPAFERVAPDGSVAAREDVLDGVRDTYDDYDSFEIEIRNVEPVLLETDRALLRYDEWQTTRSGQNGRRSSVLFGAPDGDSAEESAPFARWLHLHETWLEDPGES